MKIDLLGVKVDSEKLSDGQLDGLFKSQKKHLIFTPNTEFVMRAQRDENFKKILNKADVSLPDGIGLLWAAKFLSMKSPDIWGIKQIVIVLQWLITILLIPIIPRYFKNPISERISGADYVWDLARYAKENNLRLFLLGGGPTVAERAALVLQTEIYGLKIAGSSSLSPKDSKEIIEQINKSKADILLVAYGAPKQENWLFDNLKKTTAKIGMGIGGTFDFIAGTRKRSPKWIQRIGLEWFFRLIIEPKRIFRQLSIPAFMCLVLRKRLS